MYQDLLKDVFLDALAYKCSTNEIELPIYTIEQRPELYGFLPALVPIWIDDGAYVGYWHHWGFIKRNWSIVNQSPENNYRTREVALDFNQLLVLEFFNKAASVEKISSSDIEFAAGLNIDYKGIRNIFDAHGEGSLAYELILGGKKPLELDREKYGGSFPRLHSNLTASELRASCMVEYSSNDLQIIKGLDICPEWLQRTDQAPLFYDYLQRDDLSSAWMTLNSNGWEFKEAKVALKQLALKCKSSDFSKMAENWCSLPHEKYESY